MTSELTDQELVRRGKLAELRKRGYPYPNDVVVTATAARITTDAPAEVEKDEGQRQRLTIAGRVLSMRHMGKAAFCHVQDATGRVQLYVRRDDIGDEAFGLFKAFDLGDLVEATGYCFITKTGEPSLHVESIRLLVKCLHPLPEKWHGLKDVEIRYRQRYLDLIVNPDIKDVFIKRAKTISAIRRFFDDRGYVEVETPVLSAIASGAAARPFKTHHNALGVDLHCRVALELPLKKLVVGGIERVYELGRVFRNEGISTEHNPEFTMLEFYEAYATYETLMELTEELISDLAVNVGGGTKLQFGETEIDFSRPWKRLTMVDAIYEYSSIDRSVDLLTLEGAQAAARQLGYHDAATLTDHGRVLYEIFDRGVEEQIVHPTFITQHPRSISPLARPNMADERFVDRFELIVAGMELANAFSELNDSDDQRERFEAQVLARQSGDEEAMGLDEDFVTALEYGLPPTAGEGIGIDRLVMLLTGAQSIRDVLLFPTLRPSSAHTPGSQ
ncbi:MAG: lysine--tRNA ligase [Bdellovibrionales bacterium]|nr:lysine--tRNA ligase [Bdellovibrionales bacterium]